VRRRNADFAELVALAGLEDTPHTVAPRGGAAL
jgi:hypothetical protein